MVFEKPMRPAALITASLATLALSACASARKPDVQVPASFEMAQTSQTATSAQLETWWRQIDDPALTGLIEQALKASPDARSASARLIEAQATSGTALIAFLPQGNGQGSTKETRTTLDSGTAVNIPGYSTKGTSTNSSGNLNVSWEMDLFGRIFAVARAANGDSAAARFNYEASRASLAANVADVYFQGQGLAIQLEDARETVRIQTDLQAVAEARVTHGLISRADGNKARVDLAQAQSQAAGLEAEFQATRRTLLVLVGRGLEAGSSLPMTSRLAQVPEVPATVPGEILARRPDVREAKARIESQAGRLTYAELAFFPTFTLTPGIGLSKSQQTGYQSSTRFWSIGGTVSQPILSIPRLLTDLKSQKARTEQAVIAYEKAVQTAYGEADSALVRFAADQRRVALLSEGEAQARQASEAARIRYGAGLDDLQTTLAAELSWRAARSQMTAAQVQALRRSVQTYKALGGGWPASSLSTDKKARAS